MALKEHPTEEPLESPELKVETYALSVPADGFSEEKNLDRVFANSEDGLIAVFDGMSSVKESNLASQCALDILSDPKNRALLCAKTPEHVKAAMRALIIIMMKEIALIAVQKCISQRIGTTGVIAKQCGSSLIIANVGDSRAYYRRKGDVRHLTIDQSLINRHLRNLTESSETMVEWQKAIDDINSADELSEFLLIRGLSENLASNLAISGLNTVTAFIGNHEEAFENSAVCTTVRNIRPGDEIFLFTDGITKNLLFEELRGFLIEDASLEEKARMLIDRSQRNAKRGVFKFRPDDMSFAGMRMLEVH